jgi:prepilin-type N-terminal cleavage/methylation domain-containing protein
MSTEKGITLIELLIVIAITGVIFSVIGPVIYQLTTVSGYGNDRLTTIHELQNTAYWFNHDGQMAVSAVGGSSLVLTLPAGGPVTYSLSGNDILRTEAGSSMTLAQNIVSAAWTVQGRLVSLDITSGISGRTDEYEQNTYQVYLRPVPQ